MSVEHTVAAILVHTTNTYPSRCYAEVIGSVECGSMNAGFEALFTRPIPCGVYVDPETGRRVKEDKFGEPIKAGNLDAIIQWLQNDLDRGYYRRIPPLLGFLKGLTPEDWNTLTGPWMGGVDEDGVHLEIIDYRH